MKIWFEPKKPINFAIKGPKVWAFKGHDLAFAGVGFLKSPVKWNLVQFLKFKTPLRKFVVSKVKVKHFCRCHTKGSTFSSRPAMLKFGTQPIKLTTDLIHNTCHLCKHFRINGKKAMSCGYSGSKQVIKFAYRSNHGCVCLFYQNKRTIK